MKSLLSFLLAFAVSLQASTASGKSQSLTSPDQTPEGLAKSDWHSIRAAHEAWKHEFRQVEGVWQARNPGQQWTAAFDGRAFLATPLAASWTWGLRLESYGFADRQQAVAGTPEVKAAGQRLSYHWQGGLEEWFVNDQRGLEHGFIVATRPDGARDGQPLVFTLSTLGGLRPTVAADTQTVHFRDEAGAPILNYSGLKVWDADGTILTSWFELETDGRFRIAVEEAGARYPLTIDPIAQQAYLKASNNGGPSDDMFGNSVAVSGDTVVVGAHREDSGTTGVDSMPNEGAADSGAAYVFVRSGTLWSQQAYLKASNTGAGDWFGFSVAVSGDTVVVGSPYEDSSTTGVNSTPSESASASGAAYVFVRSGTAWSQQAYLKASNTGASDLFGWCVAASGDTVVVGAYDEDSSTSGVNSTPNESRSGSGAAYVFVRSETMWSQQAYLKASNPWTNSQFGWSVAVSGDAVVVGARWETSSTTGVNSTPNYTSFNAGAAYVFVRSGTAWSQQAYLKASNTGASDLFGISVAVSGDIVVVGATGEDSSTNGVNSTPSEGATDSGAAYVFVRSGAVWSQQAYVKASNTGANDQFGSSVSVSGDTVVVGASSESAAYVFVRTGTVWSQQAYLNASNAGGGDYFGFSVSVSGDTVVVGAYGEDSSTSGVNSAPDESARDSGAAYLFVRSGAVWSEQAYLKASNTPLGSGITDYFGSSVAVSGDTVVVGAYGEDSSSSGVNTTPDELRSDSGAVYVFVRSGTAWGQQAYLKASNTGTSDLFGRSVSVSGDTVVVGAHGEGSSTTGVNSTPDEGASGSGAAYVFVRSGTVWSQQAYLKASNTGANDGFGSSVSVSGDTVVVGASGEDSSTTGINSTPNESASASGAAYVFVRSGATWSQQAYLKASNTGVDDNFGSPVSVSGDTVVVGASGEDSSTTGINSTPNESASASGAAYVFVRSGTTWSQQAYLKASNTGRSDSFGSVSVSGDTVVVGAYGEDSSTTGVNSTPNESASSSGAAYVFVRSGAVWSQQAYLKASNTGVNDQFGRYSISVSGDTVVVGAYYEDSSTTGVNSTPNEGATDSGAAYVFVRSGTVWSEQAYLKASNTGANDNFGRSLAVSGDTVVVGADGEDSSTTGVNSTPDESASGSGAACIFSGLGPISNNANLSALTLSSGTLSPAFASGTTSYSASVANATSSLTVTPTKADTNATVTVNGASPATPVALNVGSNVISVLVTAQDGTTTKTYTVTVTRAAALPSVTSPTSSAITTTSATLGGNVTSDGGAAITERGIVFAATSANNNPLIGGTGVTKLVGTGTTGVFTVAASSLAGGTGYSFKAYATNSAGTSYSAVGTFTTLVPNSAPTDLTLSATSLAENNTAGVTIATLAAVDPDAGNTHIFELIAGDGSVDNALFTVTGNTLALTVATDFETKSSYSVRLRATDQGGLFIENTFTFNVTNINETPQIDLPSSPLVAEATSANGATVHYIITGNDPEEGVIAGSGIPASGSVFPLGDTTVEATVGDEGGLIANGSFIVRVVDTTAPSLVAPADIVIDATSTLGAVVNYPSATVTDAVGVSTISYSQDSGTLFPIGTTTVTITATDAANNTATETFIVTVEGVPAIGVETDSVVLSDGIEIATNMGQASIGQTITRLFTIRNPGSGHLVLGPITKEGPDSSDFIIGEPVNSMLPPGGSTEFSVSFSPATVGHKNVIVRIANNLTDARNPFDLQLVGNGNGAPTDILLSSSSVADKTIANSVIGTLSSADPNSEETFSYTLVNGDNSADNHLFSIEGNLLKINVSPTFETQSSYLIRIRTSDSGGLYFEKPLIIIVTKVGENAALASWAESAGLTGSNAEPLATPFQDGVPNLIKYAFNMNGSGVDVSVLQPGGSSGLPSITVQTFGATQSMRFEFVRRKGSGLIYFPEISAGLHDFTTVTATPAVDSIDTVWERVVIEQPVPSEASSCFGRIRVGLP